ncbi:MAG: dockerin type I repeat-containing protein, partial [Bacteroidota bacterium]
FSGQITVGTCNALDGRLVYDNNVQTPMAGTIVRVRDPLLVLVGNSVCDANGAFGWNSLPATTVTPEWTYVVNWGGVNATDALLVSRTFANLMSLTGLRAVAADVNANGVVNNTDALLISRRVSGLGGAFAGGDWVQDQPGPWSANIPGVPGLVRTLCKGDVNASYIPVPGP